MRFKKGGPCFLGLAILCAAHSAAQPVDFKDVKIGLNSSSAAVHLVDKYGNLPLAFEAVSGPGEPLAGVKFLSRGLQYNLFLTGNEALLALHKTRLEPARTIRMKLAGANPSPQVAGLDELPGKSNYLIGNDPRRWRTNIPNYARVECRDVYPGVNLVFYGNGRLLEHDFVISPGADFKKIRIAFEGAGPLKVDAQGDLVLPSGAEQLVFRRPVIYQEKEGVRKPINGGYVRLSGNQVGFRIPEYDSASTLVIDPVLVYSTYLGGSGNDSGISVAVDSIGNAYVTGVSDSSNFPTANPIQPKFGGGMFDVFVAKLNNSGTVLLYSTYLGGSGDDEAFSIAVDALGNAHITGRTDSPNFPLAKPLQGTLGGKTDAFVAGLNADGSALLYSTYLGGKQDESGNGIAVDSSGNIYVSGTTTSDDFPTNNPLQTYKGSGDAFVAKLDKSGSSLVYSTYLGGSDRDIGFGIAVDGSGNAFVTGATGSLDFPTMNPLQGSNGGSAGIGLSSGDAFVAKVNVTGSALLYSTYLGGSGADRGYAIAIDSLGNAYVTGQTSSKDFPTVNPLQSAYAGGFLAFTGDAFVSKLNASGTALIYSTFLGGSFDDAGYGIAVDFSGNAYVTGRTNSSDFPQAAPFQKFDPGSSCQFITFTIPCRDIFVAKLNTDASAMYFSTFLGGRGDDAANAIALDGDRNIYVTGFTNSSDFPTVAPLQARSAGGLADGLLARIADSSIVCTRSIAPPTQQIAAAGFPGSVAVRTEDGCNWSAMSNVPWITITSGSPGTGNGTITYVAAANSSTSSRSGTLTVGGRLHTVTQDGAACVYSVDSTGQQFRATDTLGGFARVTAGSNCAWTATSGAPWITIASGSSGTGNGTVDYRTEANTGMASRTGTLTVAGFTYTVTQAAPGCTYSLNPASQNFTAGAATGNAAITAGSACAWLAVKFAANPWVDITSASIGTGNGNVSYSLTPNVAAATRSATLSIAGQTFNITQTAAAAGTPIFEAGGTTSAASFVPGLTAGSIVTIFGRGLTKNVSGIVAADKVPLPLQLAGTSVQIGGVAAPLFAIANVNGAEQINLQVPYSVAGQRSVNVVVNNNGTNSPPVSIGVLPAQPGVFTYGGGFGAILHGADNRLVTAADPALPGETVVLFATGLGPVMPAPATGAPAPGVPPLSMTTTTPLVQVAGSFAIVDFSGLAPGYVGLYQVNFRVPNNVGQGTAAVVVAIGGVSSKPVALAIGAP